jgi:hypothetical protein
MEGTENGNLSPSSLIDNRLGISTEGAAMHGGIMDAPISTFGKRGSRVVMR